MSEVLRELAEELRDLGADRAEADALLEELGALRDLARRAPAPSPALAELLGRPAAAAPAAPVRRTPWARRSGVAGGVVVAVLSGVGATGLSAAANTLPVPLQERVSDFSRTYLPFAFPAPDERRPRGGLFSADGTSPDAVLPGGASPWVVDGGESPRVARPTRSADGGSATAARPFAPGQAYAGSPTPQQPSPQQPTPSGTSSSPSGSPSATPSRSPSSGPSSGPSYAPSSTPSASPRPGQGGTRPTAGPRPFVPTPRPGMGPAPTPAPSVPVSPAPPAPTSPDPVPSLPAPPEPGEPLLPTPLLPLPGLDDGDRQAPADDVAP